MNASKFSYLPKHFHCVKLLEFKGVCYSSLLGNAHIIKHKPVIKNDVFLPFYTSKRHVSIFGFNFNFSITFPFKVSIPFKFKKINSENVRSGEKEVYLLADHFKYHKKVPRVSLVKELSNTIQSIQGNGTKLIYIGGLPGTGKKELARQYAEKQYETMKKKKYSKAFVATIDLSDPTDFDQDLYKIAEKADVIENSGQFEKGQTPKRYRDILLKLSTRLQNRSGWVLILNDVNLNTDLQWQVGERHNNNVRRISNALKNFDLSHSLPSIGGSSDGTIIITTCNSFAKRHHAKNVKYFEMPNGMTDQEALQLLKYASNQENLQQCHSALKVIHGLQNVPTSVYCAGLTIHSKINDGSPMSINDMFNELHKTIQSKDFSNILTMGNEQRIDDFEYPRKMRNMQKLAVKNLSASDELREKVYTLLSCCASSAIPKNFITKVCGQWSQQDFFIEVVQLGSENSRVDIPSKTRSLLTRMSELFGSHTPSEKLIAFEAVQVANGYHEIFQELFLPLKGKTVLIKKDMFEDFTQGLIDFYNENSTIENIDTITTRKLLLPHMRSFLQLIQTTDDDEFIKSFEHRIAELNWCIGNAYRLENNFKKPSVHLKKALRLFQSQNDILKQVKVYIELGKAYREVSNTLNDSLHVLRQAELLLEQNFDDTDHETLLYHSKIFYNEGKTQIMLGNYEESGKCYSKSLEVLKKMEETEEIKQFIFMTYLNLSSVAHKIGNIKLCERYIKKAEAMIKNLVENPSLLQAELDHQKAIVKRDLCFPEESVKLLKKVCEVIKKVYTEDHAKVALIESELSVSLRHKNELEESEKVAVSSLQKLQQGDLYHTEKAKALCNLGTTYTHLCKFDKAEEHLEQALEIAENQFDVIGHTWAIRTTEILEKLGTMKRRKGEVNESFNLLKQCVKLKNKHYFSINHPDLAHALVELGKTEHRMCLLPDSFDSLNKALHIRKEHFGEHHPQTIFVKAYIAKVHRDAGNSKESLKMINEAIHQYEKQMHEPKLTVHLRKHPQYVSMHATKGMLEMDALLSNPNKKKELGSRALDSLNKALKLQENNDTPSVLQKIEIQCHRGRVHCSMDNKKMAGEIFEDAWDTASSSIGNDHPLTATVLASWSRVYYEQNNVQKAIEMLEDAWKIRDKFLRSEKHPNPLIYAYHLANYYNQIEDFENATKWYSVTINGYAYLISKENVRVKNLKEPHAVLQWDKLPVINLWYQRIEECRNCYDNIFLHKYS